MANFFFDIRQTQTSKERDFIHALVQVVRPSGSKVAPNRGMKRDGEESRDLSFRVAAIPVSDSRVSLMQIARLVY